MVLVAVGCMNNADFENKISKRQHCDRCVCYFSEIATCTSALKNTVLVRTQRPPIRTQFAANDVQD